MGEDRLDLCLKAEIVRPLTQQWKDFAKPLHQMRRVTAEVLNDTVSALYFAKLAQSATVVPEATVGKAIANSKQGKPTTLQTLAYQIVTEVLASKKIATMGAQRSAISNMAFQAFRRYLREVRGGATRSIPSFRSKVPVLFRGDQWQLSTRTIEDGKGKQITVSVISFKLHAKAELSECAVAVTGGSAHAELAKLQAAGTPYRTGDLKLQFDERKKKWYAILAYSKPRPKPLQGGIFVVHRGMVNMLYGMGEDERGLTIFAGDDVRARKLQMRTRRRELGKHRPELGTGARGHGNSRRDAALIRLRGKEERFVDTKCKQAAARMVQLALSSGAATIVMEDYTTIDDASIEDTGDAGWLAKCWPWYHQAEACVFASAKAGLGVLRVPAQYISQDCPECGCRCATSDNHKGTFHCKGCGYKRPIDYVNALHMMRRARRVLAYVGRKDASGYTIIHRADGKGAGEQYLPVTWATKDIASAALADMLEPYPEDHRVRKEFKVEPWPRAEKKDGREREQHLDAQT